MYFSSDFGCSWVEEISAGDGNWTGIDLSNDGTKGVASQYGGYVYSINAPGVTARPTIMPTTQPTKMPTGLPTRMPTKEPTRVRVLSPPRCCGWGPTGERTESDERYTHLTTNFPTPTDNSRSRRECPQACLRAARPASPRVGADLLRAADLDGGGDGDALTDLYVYVLQNPAVPTKRPTGQPTVIPTKMPTGAYVCAYVCQGRGAS